jgi:hypothetical protein
VIGSVPVGDCQAHFCGQESAVSIVGFSCEAFLSLRGCFGVDQELGLSPYTVLIHHHHHHHRIICLTSHPVHSRSLAPYPYFSRCRSHLSISCQTSLFRGSLRLVTNWTYTERMDRGYNIYPRSHGRHCTGATHLHLRLLPRRRFPYVEDGMRLYEHEVIGTCGPHTPYSIIEDGTILRPEGPISRH